MADRLTPPVATHRGINFSQPAAIDDGEGNKVGVRLFPDDDRPRRFIGCNMVNCEPPPESEVLKCNTAITGIEAIDADELLINGASLIVEQRARVIYGRLDPQTLTYVYLDPPKVIPIEDAET